MIRKCLFKTTLSALVSLSVLSAVSASAAPVPVSKTRPEVTLSAASTQQGVLEGKVLGRSKKAKVLALNVAGKVEIIKYDTQTAGVEYVLKNKKIIIQCSVDGSNMLATSISPSLVSLPTGVQSIDIDELVELVDFARLDQYVIIDVRSSQRYNEGHIPGAISLPSMYMQKKPDALRERIVDKGKKLVFYSDGLTCGMCTGAAKIAKNLGYTSVKVLDVGFEAWEEEGEMLAVSDDLLENNTAIVIDVREKSMVSAGYIPGALSIPVSDLSSDEMEYDFPTDRSAPIVFYGKDSQIAEAVSLVEGWGYRKLRQVDGGFAGWQNRGQQPTSGVAPGVEGISWQPQLGDNQISKKDFKKVMAASPEDIVILDVRTGKEAKRGRIKSSLHVALEDLTARLLEIPTDKKIVTHCATGSRAEVAALYLSQYRDDVRFLSAKVRCKGEKCRVR